MTLKAAEVKWAKVIAERCEASGVAVFVFDDEGGCDVTTFGADERRNEEMKRWATDAFEFAFAPELGETDGKG